MRKDIKRRLEKALITLQDPGGSTIRAIVKVVNQDSPILSLRKVLEALQEGIDEGFLCMYNGRFKLRQQLRPGNENGAYENIEDTGIERRENANTPDRNMSESDEEIDEDDGDKDDKDDDDDEDEIPMYIISPDRRLEINEVSAAKEIPEKRTRKTRARSSVRKRPGKKTKATAKVRLPTKRTRGKKLERKTSETEKKVKRAKQHLIAGLHQGDSSSSIPEAKSSKPSTEKPDLRRQRGPRCTSMKKDVRMPSKVHIPFVSPSVPQKGGNFNDLVRRSPDPVNGPLFDDYRVGLGFFENFC